MRRVVVAAWMLALVGALAPSAQAQIYTRKNANGVIEATNVPAEAGYRLTYVGKGTLIHSRGFRASYRGEYDAHILAASSVYGVAADLIKAVIQVESEFDPFAVSSKGAQGLMQLMPFTARRFGVNDPFDPRQNIMGGVQYLRFLLDMFQGDVALAVAGYNAGENAVARFRGVPPFKETRGYVDKIQGLLGGGLQNLGAAFFAPTERAAVPMKNGKIVPARPRIYYKWNDDSGVLHVAQSPPGDGVTYSMIRALD